MIGAERSGIFPLRIGDVVTLANRNPSTFASGNSGALISFIEPWNNTRRFGAMTLPRFVIIRKRAVKRILSGCEFYRNVIAPITRIRIIHAAVVLGPGRVPGAYPVGNWIIRGRFLADPKDGCHDFFFPRETLSRCRRISGQKPRRERDRTKIEHTVV